MKENTPAVYFPRPGGEIHGIGFENDGQISEEFFFQIHGTDEWGNQTFDGLYTGSGLGFYTIPVGQFYTGDFDWLVLVMDDDAGVGADSTFVDLEFFEGPSLLVNFTLTTISTYGGDQDAGLALVQRWQRDPA